MLKSKLFWETFFMFFVVGILNWIATVNELYWKIYEFDSLVHFLGGILVSIFFSWLYFYSGFFNPPKRGLKEFLKVSLLSILFVGVLWEAYELMIGEAKFAGEMYRYDTVLDFVMDFLGAIVGCFYAYLKEMKTSVTVPSASVASSELVKEEALASVDL